MHDCLMEMLECPVCHGKLEWVVTEGQGDRIETAEARCTACAAAYPVRGGIGVFLTPDLPRDDLWQQSRSHLDGHLREHPEVEGRLLHGPLETLAPADRFFRGLILDERGEYARAKAAFDAALPGMYTPEYLACSDRQTEYILELLSGTLGPVVDLASGMGHLVERMARRLSGPVVATDFSPGVLMRNRSRLRFLGLYDRVTLLAFDARRTPFRDGSVGTLTTYHGLPNIADPGELLRELRRVVSRRFLAVSVFYSEDDQANRAALEEFGLSALLCRGSALERFAAAGWKTEVLNSRFGRATPTPTGELLEGAGIDALPVTDTILEHCVISAR